MKQTQNKRRLLMIVSLDQVNALAKSKYKNYMITVQSADSMMLSDLAEEEDILATSIPNPIERFFTFLTLEVRDTEVDKAMLEMRITLASTSDRRSQEGSHREDVSRTQLHQSEEFHYYSGT